MIIGVVGQIASGKSILSDILVQHGFDKLAFSSEIREELRLRGLPLERKILQDIGNEMREREGNEYWAKRVIAKINYGKNYVIEGMRNPAEIEALQRLDNFILIAVDAPIERRFQWIMMRGKDGDPHTLEGIKLIDARDMGIGEESHGQKTAECIKRSDHIIINDGTKEQLTKKIEKLLKKLKINGDLTSDKL